MGQWCISNFLFSLFIRCIVECECDKEGEGYEECINIPIPRGDPQYRSDLSKRKTCLTTERSLPVADSEDCKLERFVLINNLLKSDMHNNKGPRKILASNFNYLD